VLEQARKRVGQEGPAELRDSLEQAERDTELVRRLDAARWRAFTQVRGGKPDFAGAEKEYAAALAEAGLGREGEDAGAVAARVRDSAVRQQVVAALDDWAGLTHREPLREWLLAVARGADPNPERDRLRRPELWRDPAALAWQAREARAELSPQLAAAVVRALSISGVEVVPLLRRALALHPHDLWLNTGLAVALHRAHQWEEAIGFYRAALALRADPAGYTSLALALHEAGRNGEAIEQCRLALRLEPDYAPAHNNLGIALSVSGKLDEGIRHLREAIRLDPDPATPHHNLGVALEANGEPDRAFLHYQEALSLDPRRPDTLVALGNLLQARNRLGDARDHYQRALRIDKNHAGAHTNLGAVLYRQNKWEQAVEHFRKAIRLDPHTFMAHNNLGKALFDRGRLEEAIGHYRKALDVQPTSALVHYNLALALKGQGFLDEAVVHARQAVRLNRHYVEAHTNLGNLLLALGKPEEAVRHYHAALDVDSKHALALSGLGRAWLALGKAARATEATRRCLELVLQEEEPRARARVQLRVCKGFSTLEARLPAVLREPESVTQVEDRLDFAWVCEATERYAAATTFFAGAFRKDAKAADDPEADRRFRAACCAVLAAAGQGRDAPRPGDPEQLRLQAWNWLRADLVQLTRVIQAGDARGCALVQRKLCVWQSHPGLAGVRDRESLARLPDTERRAWERLWADVVVLRKLARVLN
jgi:tetratricopeptide (TPR) repeat protein